MTTVFCICKYSFYTENKFFLVIAANCLVFSSLSGSLFKHLSPECLHEQSNLCWVPSLYLHCLPSSLLLFQLSHLRHCAGHTWAFPCASVCVPIRVHHLVHKLKVQHVSFGLRMAVSANCVNCGRVNRINLVASSTLLLLVDTKMKRRRDLISN